MFLEGTESSTFGLWLMLYSWATGTWGFFCLFWNNFVERRRQAIRRNKLRICMKMETFENQSWKESLTQAQKGIRICIASFISKKTHHRDVCWSRICIRSQRKYRSHSLNMAEIVPILLRRKEDVFLDTAIMGFLPTLILEILH